MPWFKFRNPFIRESSKPKSFKTILSEARPSRYSKKRQREIVELVRNRVVWDSLFFKRLPKYDLRFSSRSPAPFVGHFEEGDVDVIVKRIPNDAFTAHGGDYEQYLQFYRLFRNAQKEKQIPERNYVLVKISPFGSFTVDEHTYLIMERVKHRMTFNIPMKSGAVKQHLYQALGHPSKDMLSVSKIHQLSSIEIPQGHFSTMVLGNTNSKNPLQGKWILALPHDIY